MKTLRTVLPAALNKIRQGSTFLSVMGYTNNFGELSNFGIVFHVNYRRAVEKALNVWRDYKCVTALEKIAIKDLIESYTDTLAGFNPRALSAHAYEGITDGKSLIKSVKWHDNGQAVHFWGFRVHKLVLTPGDYPDEHHGEFAIVRKRLMGLTPLINFRQFKIVDGRFDSIGVEGLTLTQKHLLRKL